MNYYSSTNPYLCSSNPGKDLIDKRHELKSKLQPFVNEWPVEYQERFTDDMVNALVDCLMDDTLIKIVKGLKNIQELSESQLSQRRQSLCDSLKAKKIDTLMKNKEALKSGLITSEQSVILEQDLDRRIEDELKKLDMELIMELDQIVSDQQGTLQNAGVPGFHVSNKPNDIQLQMHIISVISKLGGLS